MNFSLRVSGYVPLKLGLLLFFLQLISLWSLPSQAGNEIESLSPGLRDLLRREMIALEKGMAATVPAYIRGDYKALAHIAGQMKASYIQRQEISWEQSAELKKKLPQGFKEKDRLFHRLAGMLQRAAEEQNMESASYYHARILETCVGCHREYALHRFPALGAATTAKQQAEPVKP